jgi:hypothetical protein
VLGRAQFGAATKATICTGWIYDHLLPHAHQVKVAHPLMLRTIAAAKKKNEQMDASKDADCLRCGFLPERHISGEWPRLHWGVIVWPMLSSSLLRARLSRVFSRRQSNRLIMHSEIENASRNARSTCASVP